MNTYETSSTVDDKGQVHLAGVPFAPGTEVEVTISPKSRSSAAINTAAPAAAGLGWKGNVLVHHGTGAAPSVSESRDERLNHLTEGLSG